MLADGRGAWQNVVLDDIDATIDLPKRAVSLPIRDIYERVALKYHLRPPPGLARPTRLTRPHLTWPHLTRPHLTRPHLTRPHLTRR